MVRGCAKPPSLEMTTPVAVSGAAIVSVTRGWLVYFAARLIVTPTARPSARGRVGHAGVPVPLRGTACGSWAVFAETFKAAARGPTALGANRTLTAQAAPTATARPVHASATTVKSPALVPAMATPVMRSGESPVLARVTGATAGTEPTLWAAKAIAGTMPKEVGAVNNSALARRTVPAPPATSTRPSGSSVAVWPSRAVLRPAAGDHVFVAGS